MELKGKNVIVTGATGKLGAEICLSLAKRSCNCICHYFSNKDRAKALVEQIGKLGVKAKAISADLSKLNGIGKFFKKQQFGISF